MDSFQVTWHAELASTNTHLRDRAVADPNLPSGTVIAARCQTAGRGRHNRSWITEPGRDLAFSFLWRGQMPPETLPSLLMAASLAVADALGAFGVDARCKWPNDALARNRKICGILAEFVPRKNENGGGEGRASARPQVCNAGSGRAEARPSQTVFLLQNMEQAAVVGIGVNINMTAAEAAAIDRPATSVLIETGKSWPIESVLAAILDRLAGRVAQWEQGGFEGLRRDWERYVVGLGLPVVIEQDDQRKAGVLAGFDTHGALRLRHKNGEEDIVLLGDVL